MENALRCKFIQKNSYRREHRNKYYIGAINKGREMAAEIASKCFSSGSSKKKAVDEDGQAYSRQAIRTLGIKLPVLELGLSHETIA